MSGNDPRGSNEDIPRTGRERTQGPQFRHLNPLYFLTLGSAEPRGRGRAFHVAASRWHLLQVQVRTYADLPGMISVPSRFLPLTAFRELLFGPALSLSRVSWVSPLVLTGSISSSHTSPDCSSEAPSQDTATVSRQKLQHGSSRLISSPGRIVLGLPALLLMFLCQVPTTHRQTRFNRAVDRRSGGSGPSQRCNCTVLSVEARCM